MHVRIKRQRGMKKNNKKKKQKYGMQRFPSTNQRNERFLAGVHVSVSRHYVHAQGPTEMSSDGNIAQEDAESSSLNFYS